MGPYFEGGLELCHNYVFIGIQNWGPILAHTKCVRLYCILNHRIYFGTEVPYQGT